MRFPKQPGKSYPQEVSRVPTEKLEGLSRTLFVAAPLLRENPELVINGVDVAEYYRFQIGQLVDESVSAYIPPRAKDGGPHQHLVEYGALAISLAAAPKVLWEPLPSPVKAKLAASMLSYADGPTVPSNWKFFNIFILSFFKAQGYEVNEMLLQEYLEKSLDHYRGQGWYNDNPAFDYYSMWAFQMYGALWAQWYGSQFPDLAARLMANFRDLNGHYAPLFSRDGEMIMWGRSISYRMAAVTPLAFMGFQPDPAVNYGWMRRIASGTLLQFLQHPEFLEDNVPTLGFYGEYEPAVQVYSCRGSVYWMGKVFLSLLVPEESPFWQATENEGDWAEWDLDEVKNHFHAGAEILVTNYPALGASEVRAWCHERVKDDWQQFRATENYNRLAYHSAFPWQTDGPAGEVAMNYLFQNQTAQWEAFRLFTFQRYEKGIYYREAVLETDEEVRMQLADIPLPNGHLRVDLQESSKSVDMRLGHYALPDVGFGLRSERRLVKGRRVEVLDNGVHSLAVVPLTGWNTMEIKRGSGLHPEADQSAVINLQGRYEPGQERVYTALMLWGKSGDSWTEDSLLLVRKVKRKERTVVVKLADGTVHEVFFP